MLLTDCDEAAKIDQYRDLRDKGTGWKRPGHGHGCTPVEIDDGIWTATYHDIDTKEKLKKVFEKSKTPVKLVVNSAPCQCEATTGFYGNHSYIIRVYPTAF